MALSKRLLALYRLVPRGSIVADIGCDHGQLSIALTEQGIAPHVFASDLRPGPLSRAKEAVAQMGLQNQIDCYLRNGLDELSEAVTTVVIAGMGFDTIKTILEAHPEAWRKDRLFIIQSNKHVDELRGWISDHHFTIVAEDLVEEDHFYEIVAFTCEVHESYTEDDCLFGVVLRNHPMFVSYWTQRLNQLQEILAQMPESHTRRKDVESLADRIIKELHAKKELENQ